MDVTGLPLVCLGCVLGVSWGCLRSVLGVYQGCLGGVFVVSWDVFGVSLLVFLGVS